MMKCDRIDCNEDATETIKVDGMYWFVCEKHYNENKKKEVVESMQLAFI